jgi:hypothetical protein
VDNAGPRRPTRSTTFSTKPKPFFNCPMCGGILEERPPSADLEIVQRIGECLCADELMLIFTQGIDRGADPCHGYVIQMLDEYMLLAERLAERAKQRGAVAAAAELKRRARAAARRSLYLREPYVT